MSKETVKLVEMIYQTDKRTYYKGWVHLADNIVEELLIDKRAHPNFQDGTTLPKGIILIPCSYGMREQPRKAE